MPDASSTVVPFPGPGAPSCRSRPVQIDMRSDLVEQAIKVIPEPPTLINLVSARVKQLNLGRPPLVRTDHRMGAADIALTEIIEEKIGVKEGEDDEK